MALTAEQQSTLDYTTAELAVRNASNAEAQASAQAVQAAILAGQRTHEIAMEALRKQSMLDVETARASGEAANRAAQYRATAVSLAKDILLENRKDLPAGSRQVTSTDVTTMAASLISFVEGS